MTNNVRVRFLPLLLLALVARFADAQVAGVTRAPTVVARDATVSGVVFDSLARRPLAGATVQLVGADDQSRFGETVAADQQGQFRFSDVPNGRYHLGFFHPILDTLSLEPIVRELVVAGQSTVRADLSTPSPARLRAAICGRPSATNDGGLLIGTVRRANDRKPASGVSVAAEWIEYSISRGGVSRRTPRRVATTNESGWFAICNVPSPGSMTIIASRDADSTDVIELEVAADGVVRRELYLGSARTVVLADTARPAAATGDSTRRAGAPAPTRRIHLGEGRLSGTVIAAETGAPLSGAQVAIPNGPQTRTNVRGEWALGEVPAGTRVLEVRAVGFYPARQTVDVVDDAAPVRVEMQTFTAVLNTVKVTASYDRFRRTEEFKERARSGQGRYLTADDIAKRQLVVASDIFRNMSGVYLDGHNIEDRVKMRDITGDRCAPTFYLNGSRIDSLTVSEIDIMVRPREIAGIETYMPGTVPLQFQPPMTGCGSILIWTK